MFERLLFLPVVAMLFAIVACGDSRDPIPGMSGTPTPTGAGTLPSSTATSDVPPAKLTAIVAETIPPTPRVSTTCPLSSGQCDFATRLDTALSRGDYTPILDRLVLSPMTCPTVADLARHQCEGKASQQVDAFFFASKLGMYLTIDDAKARRSGFLGEIAPARPVIVAVGCPVAGSCAEAFAIVLRWQNAPTDTQGLVFSLRASTNGWSVDSAQYLIHGDNDPALSNGTMAIAANGKNVDYAFTRWQP